MDQSQTALNRYAFLWPLAPALAVYAAGWVAGQERRILAEGAPLDPSGLALAESVGVTHPGRIRVLNVPQIPVPLAALSRKFGVAPATVAGMAMRYGIFVRGDSDPRPRLLAHELAHTAQYERAGSLHAFLTRYIRECLTHGYDLAPLEWEAERLAVAACG